MMQCDAAPAVVKKAILLQVEKGYLVLPSEISLKALEKVTGARAQTIGMAFRDYIELPLKMKGICARKCGQPGRTIIQLGAI